MAPVNIVRTGAETVRAQVLQALQQDIDLLLRRSG